MKLINMKRTTREGPQSAAPDMPMYPWGLQLNLDTDALEKLGLKDKLPAIGGTLTLTAKVDVTSVSESENEYGSSCSLGLQITDMALGGKSSKSDADVLYGDKDK